MIQLIITLGTQRTPHCPMCCCELPGVAMYFHRSIAFCAACAHDVDPRQVNMLKALHDEYGFADCFTTSRGLLLWTPPPHAPKNISAWIQMAPEASIYGRGPAPLNSWDRTAV